MTAVKQRVVLIMKRTPITNLMFITLMTILTMTVRLSMPMMIIISSTNNNNNEK